MSLAKTPLPKTGAMKKISAKLLADFLGFAGELRQEVVAFLQVGGGVFPELFGHLRLLRVEATEALLGEQACLRRRGAGRSDRAARSPSR